MRIPLLNRRQAKGDNSMIQRVNRQPYVVNLVKEYINQLSLIEHDAHIAKLNILKTGTSNGIIFSQFDQAVRQGLIANDFCAFVKMDIITKFKYHAQLYSWNVALVKQSVWGDAVVYAGDIPDNMLDRILKAKNLGVENITIHSLMPFPTQLIHCDPIVIGWAKSLTIYPDSGNRVNIEPFFNSYGIIEGIILAMWDYDKEMAVL